MLTAASTYLAKLAQASRNPCYVLEITTGLSPLTVQKFSTAPVFDYQSEVLADGPNLYLRLGESSGVVAADSSGNGLDASIVGPTLGTAGTLTGDSNTAFTFDGISTYCAVVDDPLLDLTSLFTIEGRV